MGIGLPGDNGLDLTRRIKADYLFSKDALLNDGVFPLVKSILLTKGFNADGSQKA